ncbi:MAG: pilus assembly protein TadG-related protein [Actinomycetota bacterium]
MLVMVVVLCVVLIGCAAFAVDAGALWAKRRQLITATDAAALAAAQSFAQGTEDCTRIAREFLVKNDPQATLTGCGSGNHSGPRHSSGQLQVEATSQVPLAFAGIFGIHDGTVRAATRARYGPPAALRRLRPIGICPESTPAIEAWIDSQLHQPANPSGTIRVSYTKSHPDACGANAPGNWGMLDLDGGNNSNAATRDWIENGYDGSISANAYVEGDPGAISGSLSGSLDALVQSGTLFELPLFDDVRGNGANAEFRVSGFVSVRLIGYRVTGAESGRYLDIQLHRRIVDGQCCATGLNTGVSVVMICAVDDTSNC